MARPLAKAPAVRVNSGQQVRFSGEQFVAAHGPSARLPRDGFDDWAQVRDKRLDNSVSARYVSPGVIGYQDLDSYGVWQTSPQYGSVWVPTSVPRGLGALPLRSLGVDRTLGMDLGG